MMCGFGFRRVRLIMLLAASMFLVKLHAQDLRDPTRPPAGAFAYESQAGSSASGAGESTRPASAAVIMRDGKPYLIYEARWYAVGQQMGPYKIERITETEVWLRSSQGLQKIQRYDGIQRRTVQP